MENETNVVDYSRWLKGRKSAGLSILVVALLTDIFYITESFDVITFGLLGFYIFGIKLYKLSSRATFLFCLVLLILTYVQFLFLGSSVTTEKSAVWFVLFFIVGVIQRFRE